MDYLDRLPTELWREILLIVRLGHYWSPPGWIIPIKSTIFRLPYDEENREDLQKEQAEFSRLLVVCKRLHPLIEEMLWPSLYLSLDRAFDGSFERAALGIGASGRPRGEKTRELRIFEPSIWPDDLQYTSDIPWSPHTLCPNLRDYSISDTDTEFGLPLLHLLHQNEHAASWASKITKLSIQIEALDYDEVIYIAEWFTSLHSLSMKNVWWEEAPSETITFPTLRHLSISDYIYSIRHILPAINAPKLELLHMDDFGDGSDGIFRFLSNIKDSLISLSTYHFPSHADNPSEPPFLTALEALPRLRSLTTSIDNTLRGVPTPSHRIRTPMTGVMFPLEELIVLVSPPEYGCSGCQTKPGQLSESLLHCFPKERFPHLKRLGLKMNVPTKDRDLAISLVDAAKSAMPQADVEFFR